MRVKIATAGISKSPTLLLIIAIIALFFSVSQAFGYGKTHAYITEQAFKVWPADTNHEIYRYLKPTDTSLLAELREHKPIGSVYDGGTILEGVVEEDHGVYVEIGIEWKWWMDHSWNPDNNQTWSVPIIGVIEHTAVEKGIWMFLEACLQYKKGNKPLAYWYLGRAAHCLQDMSVPAHTHCDIHVKDRYEEWADKRDIFNIALLKPLDLSSKELLDPPEDIKTVFKNPQLEKLFYNLAQAAQWFPSNKVAGDSTNVPPFVVQEKWPSLSISDLQSEDNLCKMGSYLLPRAIQFTAALYRIFWETTRLLAVNVNITSVDSSDFPEIKLYTTVEAGGKPVFDLGSSHFKVYEDQTRESPISVTSVGAGFVGTSVVIIMDTSGSMEGSPIAAAREAAISFVNNLKPEDKAALIRFREYVTIVQPFTDDKDAVISAIRSLYAEGKTALYDALYKGVAMASTQPGIKALVALTDGKDNSSVKTAKEVIDYAKSVKVPVYIIGLGEDINEDVLRLIAKETEAQYYRAPTPAELQQLYESISERLKNLYEISYTTHNPERDGSIRSVTVQVTYNEASGQDTIEYTAPILAGAITGVVLDSKTKKPIPFAKVIVEHETERLKVTDASVNTDKEGKYLIGNLSPDFAYKVTASASNYYPATYPSLITVEPSKVTEDINLELQPIEDYLIAKQTLIEELRDKEKAYAEEENKAEQFLTKLKNKGISVTEQEKEAVQRLYLVEDFANQAYKDAKRLAQLGTNGLGGFVDVSMAIISTCGGVGEALKKIPFIGKFLASPYMAAKKEAVNQIALKSHIFLSRTPKDDILLREAITKGYNKIFLEASKHLAVKPFSDAMAETHKFIEKEFFLGIYEMRTANFIDKSVEWAQETPPVFQVGALSRAKSRVDEVLNSMKVENEEKIENAEMLIWTGSTIGKAGAIASSVVLAGGVVLSALSAKTIIGASLAAPLMSLSAKISIATNAAAAGMKIGSAAEIGIYLWSIMPNYIKEGTAYSFDMPPSALEAPPLPVVKAPPLLTEGRKYISSGFHAPSIKSLAPMQQGISNYSSILREILRYIQNDKPEEVQKALETLIRSGDSLLGDINVSAAQIIAASPQALHKVPDYDAIYSEFETDLSKATLERINLYTLLASYLANPTDPSIKELLSLQIAKTIDANDELNDTLISTTQTIRDAQIAIPTLVIVKSFSAPDLIPRGEPFIISAIIKNIGETSASQVNVKLSVPEDSGLNLRDEDTKSLGDLSAGAEKEVSFQLEFSPRGQSQEGGVKTVRISIGSGSTTPNFDTLPPTYILIPAPPPTPPTGGKLSNKNVYAYPNPFNPETGRVNIRYSLSKAANVTIKIYDVSGELVTTLIDRQWREKGIEYSEPWDGRNDRGDIVANGVYFYLITTDKGEKAVGKIAVLR